ncbi:MAG: alanine--tRNA ligase-related protein, partial [Bacillota bacterium]|nr:alanine--tRNA ligase-related protein [Bacillota bacterium]
DGAKAFKLHDTYGFPIDLTREIIAEKDFDVDIEGFQKEMELQKERSRTEQDMEGAGWKDKSSEFIYKGETEFVGYEKTECNANVEALVIDNELYKEVKKGDKCYIILDKTPFYAESGGQVADDGYIYNESGGIARVDYVYKFEKVFAHQCEIEEGSFTEGDKVDAMIFDTHRNITAANHSATHMLQKALQEVLGDHVKQSGSHVDRHGLRFDFTHYQAMTPEEIHEVEELINDKIRHFIPVTTKVMNIKEAEKEGAMALFGEKYGEEVRVVSIGQFSKEFCGGTHVQNAGDIGAFKIVSESGVASGVRRIEAITSQVIKARYDESEDLLSKTADILKAKKDVLLDKAAALMEENKALKKEIEELKKAEMNKGMDSLVDDAVEINGVKLIAKQFDDYGINDLRELSDQIKASNKGVAMVFAAVAGGKVTFLVSLTDDLVEKGMHAGKMIKEIAAAAGGGGGGKADMAQAGAKDPSKLNDAFAKAEELIKNC